MVPGFKPLFDCNNKLPELRKEDTNWVDYMNPDAMTTLLGDAIYNIEEEEYWEVFQHALKSPYEAKTNDEDEEGGEAPSDDDEGSDNKSDSSHDSSSSNIRDSEDDNNNDSDSNSSDGYDSQYSGNDWGEPLSDREDEDVGHFCENHFNDDVDYYDGDIEDNVEAEPIDIEDGTKDEENELETKRDDVEVEDEEVEATEADDIDYDDYPYRRPLDWSCITDVSSTSGLRYDKHGGEIPNIGSFHNSEFGSLTLYIKEEDDIDARLATPDKKLMIHSFKNLTLENLEDEDERLEGDELEYLPQYIFPSNKGK